MSNEKKQTQHTEGSHNGAWLRLQGFAILCKNNGGHNVTHHDPVQLSKDLGELLAATCPAPAVNAHAALLQERERLREALKWALHHISRPIARLKQNEQHYDRYHEVEALLKEPTP